MILLKDCIEGMKELEESSIDAIVTSPPYNLNIKYGLYSDNKDFLNNIPNIHKNNNLTSIHPILKMALEDALNDGSS